MRGGFPTFRRERGNARRVSRRPGRRPTVFAFGGVGRDAAFEVDEANVTVARGGDASRAAAVRDELVAEDVVDVAGVHGTATGEARARGPHAHAQVVAAGQEETRVVVPRERVDASAVSLEDVRQAKAVDERRVADVGAAPTTRVPLAAQDVSKHRALARAGAHVSRRIPERRWG